MTADDTITRAAEVLRRRNPLISARNARAILEILADAGLLVTRAHDAAVEDRVLRAHGINREAGGSDA